MLLDPGENTDSDDGIGNSSDPDDDNDGLTDVEEVKEEQIQTTDTDGDGLSDSEEVNNG